MPIDTGFARLDAPGPTMMDELAAVTEFTSRGDRFLIAAGGTGGHVIPAIEVAEVLRSRGHECVFVGTERGLENRLVPAAGFALRHVPIGPLNRVSFARRFRTLIESPRAIAAAWSLIDEYQPAAVLSLGGYASGPLSLVSALRDTPVVVMEPNAKPGMANRLVGMYASRALLGFAGAEKYFRSGSAKVVGVPVRERFFERIPRAVNDRFTVLITGGSQGSRRLNDAALGAARLWMEAGGEMPAVIHQTGRNDFEQIREAYTNLGFDAEVAAFFDDIPSLYARADLVICRAGASAVAELCAAAKASVLVPFPHAADNHQFINAQGLATAGGAEVVADSDWTAEEMVRTVDRLRHAPADVHRMEIAAGALAKPQAAKCVAQVLERYSRRKEVSR